MLSRSDFKKIVLSEDVTEVRDKFQNTFSAEIESFLDEIFASYEALKSFEARVGTDLRKQYVATFIFYSMKVLVDSFSLYISGYAVLSCSLMRHFIESLSMAVSYVGT